MQPSSAIIKPIVQVKNVSLIAFSAVFVAISVALPWLAHQFNLAGPTFLPMHIFVLTAGLLLGWRAGLVVGLLTPLVSYATSGMPVLPVLPQITVEVMLYGLAAGFCREKLKLNLYVSLLAAMLVGRLGLLLAVWLLGTGPVGPVEAVWRAVSLGWPGIAIQLALVPLAAVWLKKYLKKVNEPTG